ncbi:MAG TPA: hypothetical protein VFW25_02020 [Silvibacterium sp.]|nr:hypothetical protein [Silvibacterium sp.]
MIELCRHTFLDGRFCRGAAVGGTFFCRHHDSVRKTLTQPRRAATSGVHQLLPFAYPEDRKAIQLNLFLVQNALNEGAIDPRRANAFTNVMRAQMSNLARIEAAEARAQQNQPLTQSETQTETEEPRLAAQPAIHQIYQMVLTPEGEQIALPRYAPEENDQEEKEVSPTQPEENSDGGPIKQSLSEEFREETGRPLNELEAIHFSSVNRKPPAVDSPASSTRNSVFGNSTADNSSQRQGDQQLGTANVRGKLVP